MSFVGTLKLFVGRIVKLLKVIIIGACVDGHKYDSEDFRDGFHFKL